MTRVDNIRKEILLQLYAVRPLALSADRIARDARKQSYDFVAFEISRELAFLSDRGLVIAIKDAAGTAQMFRIHAEGIAYYEQNYAA